MGIQPGVRYYLKEMKRMTKILTLKIKVCRECPYFSSDWCEHPDRNEELVGVYYKIPNWCPLIDIEDEEDG